MYSFLCSCVIYVWLSRCSFHEKQIISLPTPNDGLGWLVGWLLLLLLLLLVVVVVVVVVVVFLFLFLFVCLLFFFVLIFVLFLFFFMALVIFPCLSILVHCCSMIASLFLVLAPCIYLWSSSFIYYIIIILYMEPT